MGSVEGAAVNLTIALIVAGTLLFVAALYVILARRRG